MDRTIRHGMRIPFGESVLRPGCHETHENTTLTKHSLYTVDFVRFVARGCSRIGGLIWRQSAVDLVSIGVLSGGYGEDELIRAGAYRVYRDAAELDESLDELGVL
jgi:hypothetical protein